MTRGRIAILFALVLLVLAFVSQSIVKISLVQLRVLLAREQLLNYELSSRMLRAKFKQMLLQQDDLTTEVKMKVLESSVMNFDQTERVRLSGDERIGLWVVNLVRLLNLKPLLSLEEDQNRLLLLQAAFHMERTRKYAEAAKRYTALEDQFSSGDENLAFVLLHNGFSLALSGQTVTALEKLERVEDEYRGTHYQENATILISILREGKKRQEEIEKTITSEIERARALYRNGQYAAALRSYDKSNGLTLRDRYQRSRSMEEVGRTQPAINEYMKLANQNRDRRVARDANRRLLVIGEVYGGGEKVKKYAEDKAKKLGDTAILKEVQQVASLKKETDVMERIQKKLSESPESLDENTLEQLQDIKDELETTLAEEEKQVATIVQKQETREDDAAKKKAAEEARKKREEAARRARRRAAANRLLAARPGKTPLRLRVELSDGRRVRGHSLRRLLKGDNQYAEIQEKFVVRIPMAEVNEISLDSPAERATLMLAGSGPLLFGNRLTTQPVTVGDLPEELRETQILYLNGNGKRREVKGETTIFPIIPAAGGLTLLVEWKGGKKTYATDVAVRGKRLISYSKKHRLELGRAEVTRVELVAAARRNLELDIRLAGGARLNGRGVKASWRGMQIQPGGRTVAWDKVRDLLPVPKK